MGTEAIALTVLAALVLVLLLLVLQVLRRLQQLRRGGVDVAVRSPGLDGPATSATDRDGWHSGIARYRGDQFRWFRISGLRTAPNVVLDRSRIEIVDRRPARDTEMHRPSATVLRCRTPDGTWEIAMTPDVLTGFSSWLESRPPGRSTGYRQTS